MKSIYDKLGDLINDSIQKGFIPNEKSGNDTSTAHEKKFVKRNETDESIIKSTVFTQDIPLKLKDTTNDKKTVECLELLNSLDCVTMDEVRKNYRILLKKYHPDSVPDLPKVQETAKTKTMRIMEAFSYVENAFKK